MHTSTTSNCRPILRAFCASLIAIAALLVMSGNAYAQLYVAEAAIGVVGKYNAQTGAAINANFITGLTATGLAVWGNKLFVANEDGTAVSTYDTITGAAINASLVTGLTTAQGLAIRKRHRQSSFPNGQ